MRCASLNELRKENAGKEASFLTFQLDVPRHCRSNLGLWAVCPLVSAEKIPEENDIFVQK